MEPLKRSTCSEIVKRLEIMHKRCQKDQEYCTRKAIEEAKLPPGKQRTTSTLSEISSLAGNIYRESEKLHTSAGQVADGAGITEEELAVNNVRTAAEGAISASN